MMKTDRRSIPAATFLLLSGMLAVNACSSARVEGPSRVYREACRIMEEAPGAGANDAVPSYIEALEMLTKIRDEHPSWNASLVNRRMEDCRRYIDAHAAEAATETPREHRDDGAVQPADLLERARRIAAEEGELREREKEDAPPGAAGVGADIMAPPVITFREAEEDRVRPYSEAAVEHYEKARERIGQKDYNGAIGELREAVYLEGDYVEALIALGEIYETVGEDGIAVEAYRSSLAIDDDTPDAHCGIGNIRIREGMRLEREGKMMEAWSKYQDAVLEYKRATWVDIGCAPAYYGIGVAYSRLGRHADAAYYWKKTLETAGEGSEYGERAKRNLAVTGLAP